MLCKHDYHLIDKEVLKTRAEILAENFNADNINIPVSFFNQYVVLTFKCDKCKKIRVIEK